MCHLDGWLCVLVRRLQSAVNKHCGFCSILFASCPGPFWRLYPGATLRLNRSRVLAGCEIASDVLFGATCVNGRLSKMSWSVFLDTIFSTFIWGKGLWKHAPEKKKVCGKFNAAVRNPLAIFTTIKKKKLSWADVLCCSWCGHWWMHRLGLGLHPLVRRWCLPESPCLDFFPHQKPWLHGDVQP